MLLGKIAMVTVLAVVVGLCPFDGPTERAVAAPAGDVCPTLDTAALKPPIAFAAQSPVGEAALPWRGAPPSCLLVHSIEHPPKPAA